MARIRQLALCESITANARIAGCVAEEPTMPIVGRKTIGNQNFRNEIESNQKMAGNFTPALDQPHSRILLFQGEKSSRFGSGGWMGSSRFQKAREKAPWRKLRSRRPDSEGIPSLGGILSYTQKLLSNKIRTPVEANRSNRGLAPISVAFPAAMICPAQLVLQKGKISKKDA